MLNIYIWNQQSTFTQPWPPASVKTFIHFWYSIIHENPFQIPFIAPFGEDFALGLVEVVLEASFCQWFAAPFEFGSDLPPESCRIFDTLLVHGVVVFHGIQSMRTLLDPRRRHFIGRQHLAKKNHKRRAILSITLVYQFYRIWHWHQRIRDILLWQKFLSMNLALVWAFQMSSKSLSRVKESCSHWE